MEISDKTIESVFGKLSKSEYELATLRTVLKDLVEVLGNGADVIEDYIERIEKQNEMTSLNWGREVVRQHRAALTAANKVLGEK